MEVYLTCKSHKFLIYNIGPFSVILRLKFTIVLLSGLFVANNARNMYEIKKKLWKCTNV
jgi:hypothetical protein